MSFAAKTEQLKARRGSTRRTWLPVAGLGLAASVAAAGFIAWQANKSQSGLGGAPTELAQNTVESDTSPGNTSQSVLLANATVRTVYQREPGTRWVVSTSAPRDKQVEQRLNSLLINHLEDSTMGRVQGMMAHSRVVSYDSGVVNKSF